MSLSGRCAQARGSRRSRRRAEDGSDAAEVTGPRGGRRVNYQPAPTALCEPQGDGPLIQFFRVTKQYGSRRPALDEVSFQVQRGQFVFLQGPSGAGKTTLLRLIYREEIPDAGSVLVNGRNVAALPRQKIPYLRRTIGVVFQDFHLIARKTVLENVIYLPRILGASPRLQRRLAEETLARVGLADRLDAYPLELSGGEQQRVAIARAVINQPDILIADEPTGNLDPELSRQIIRLFLEINLAGTTVVLATHDPLLIARAGGRILALEAGRLVGDERVTADPEARDADVGPGAGAPSPETAAAGLGERT